LPAVVVPLEDPRLFAVLMDASVVTGPH